MDGFLSRWSQRKRAATKAVLGAETGLAGPLEANDLGADLQGEEAGRSARLPITEPCPEHAQAEVVGVLSIADITADTDMTTFLRKEVPEALRNEALRRAWSLDPKIRDYVCEAREYAYDWNMPHNVPGNGPLWQSENLKKMVEAIIGPPSSVPEGNREEQAGLSVDRDDLRPHDAPAAELSRVRSGLNDATQQEPKPQVDAPGETSSVVGRRRHGGATPV
jgi:hypothetical protein